jgi:cyclophilin family peptidyl-prolyl cis-trans isomerase
VSKKSHRRQLERARAKRESERMGARRRRTRAVAVTLVFLLVGGTVVALVASGGDDVPDPEVLDTADPFATATPDDPAATAPDDDPTAPSTPGDLEALPPPPDPASLEPCDTTRPDGADAEKPSWDAPPEMTIDQAATYTATVGTTCGDITVELFAADAPIAVNSFVFLAANDFYDAVPFHRTIWGFMVQGGDPTGTGTGGPGYSFEDELGTVSKYGFARGNLAMANSGPATNGSQFFIVQGDASHLTTHTVFGRVTGGIDVVDRIAAMPAGPNGEVEAPVWMTDVTITES